MFEFEYVVIISKGEELQQIMETKSFDSFMSMIAGFAKDYNEDYTVAAFASPVAAAKYVKDNFNTKQGS